jgi:hypothetical protein
LSRFTRSILDSSSRDQIRWLSCGKRSRIILFILSVVLVLCLCFILFCIWKRLNQLQSLCYDISLYLLIRFPWFISLMQ